MGEKQAPRGVGAVANDRHFHQLRQQPQPQPQCQVPRNQPLAWVVRATATTLSDQHHFKLDGGRIFNKKMSERKTQNGEKAKRARKQRERVKAMEKMLRKEKALAVKVAVSEEKRKTRRLAKRGVEMKKKKKTLRKAGECVCACVRVVGVLKKAGGVEERESEPGEARRCGGPASWRSVERDSCGERTRSRADASVQANVRRHVKQESSPEQEAERT